VNRGKVALAALLLVGSVPCAAPPASAQIYPSCPPGYFFAPAYGLCFPAGYFYDPGYLEYKDTTLTLPALVLRRLSSLEVGSAGFITISVTGSVTGSAVMADLSGKAGARPCSERRGRPPMRGDTASRAPAGAP
jgi:hypothetical protein